MANLWIERIDDGVRADPADGDLTPGAMARRLDAVARHVEDCVDVWLDVYRAVQVVDLPRIGVGGIFSAEDALRYLMAGATAVQIGSANLADLWAPVNILRQLEGFFREEGIGNLKEIIGAAQVKAPV